MRKFETGDLVALIDSDGAQQGVAIFMDLYPPGTLNDGECVTTNFWNLKVLHSGKMKYLDTSRWTLLPIE